MIGEHKVDMKLCFLRMQVSATLPPRNIGTLLNDNTFKISIALRIGSPICQPHICHCGEMVDIYGTHGLKCRFSAGRHVRHQELNQIIKRSLTTSKIPATLFFFFF